MCCLPLQLLQGKCRLLPTPPGKLSFVHTYQTSRRRYQCTHFHFARDKHNVTIYTVFYIFVISKHAAKRVALRFGGRIFEIIHVDLLLLLIYIYSCICVFTRSWDECPNTKGKSQDMKDATDIFSRMIMQHNGMF